MSDPIELALAKIQTDILDETDISELARTLYFLQKFRKELSEVIDSAHVELSKRLKKVETDLGPGIGVVRKTRDVRSSWNHEEMMKMLLDQHRKVDPETGEVQIDGFELANSVRECVAFSYWRKTKLRERKIDFEDCVSEVYGQPRVRFVSKEGT